MKLLIFSLLAIFGTQLSGKEVITKMHNRYAGKWRKTLTFAQNTERYRNDTLVSNSIWTEVAAFPFNLRIDMGAKSLGNSVIYTRDSTFSFRNNKKVSATTDHNELIFLVGGMYAQPLDIVLETFKKNGYNLDKMHVDNWKGKEVYVLGANKDENANQLWIEKDRLILLRMVRYDKNRKQEILFDDHKKLGRGWSETKVSFYINDKLLMIERYKDLKADPVIDNGIFDPVQFGKVSWY